MAEGGSDRETEAAGRGPGSGEQLDVGRLWRATRSQLARSSPWYVRNWFLLLAYFAGCALFAWYCLALDPPGGSRLARFDLLFKLIVLPLSVLWLLPTLYFTAANSYMCLAPVAGRRMQSLQLDELLALSPLSDAQLLRGALMELVRPVWPRVLLVALICSVLFMRQVTATAGFASPAAAWQGWLLIVACLVLMSTSAVFGLVGTILLFLVLGSWGGNRVGGFLAGGLNLLLQPGLLIAGIILGDQLSMFEYLGPGNEHRNVGQAVLLAVCGALGWLALVRLLTFCAARSSRPQPYAAAILAFLMLGLLGLYCFRSADYDWLLSTPLGLLLVWPWHSLAWLDPTPLLAATPDTGTLLHDVDTRLLLGLAVLQLVLQGCLCRLLYVQGLAAVHRRRRGVHV